MKIDIAIPTWLNWIVPKWLYDDLERRSKFNSKASRSIRDGKIVSVSVSAEE